jgi:hypothetical protein
MAISVIPFMTGSILSMYLTWKVASSKISRSFTHVSVKDVSESRVNVISSSGLERRSCLLSQMTQPMVDRFKSHEVLEK